MTFQLQISQTQFQEGKNQQQQPLQLLFQVVQV